MTPAEMNAALAVHSARAEPIIPDGWQVPNGYILRGPRGNKKVVGVDASGNVPDFDVRLWLEGVAYGDKRMAAKKRNPPTLAAQIAAYVAAGGRVPLVGRG